jgi:2-dehydro-3-deoxyphosphogluconate aldolase/(4S)-4-hydroxy-2-oxoglutarate aldolase
MTAEALRQGEVAGAIRDARLVVVLRRVAPRERLLDLVSDLCNAGARIFEITWDAPEAAADLGAVRAALGAWAVVGAGTIRTLAELTAARAAGAAFAVAPVLDVELVRQSVESGMPFVPGAFTPSEIAAAWSAGATFVKLFPASAVGPSFVRELRGPMPAVELVPTGGVDATNATEFLAAGAAAVGIGSAIVRASPAERRALVERLARPS